MKNAKTFVQRIAILCICTSVSAQEKTPAFPEAQGFGAFTKGGRGGEVFIVTTTEDYGDNEPVIKGSLREAVEARIPRMVVFEISGIIELKRNLKIENPFVTIAGQTAPGDGICLKDYSLSVSADHCIVRYLRVRLGDAQKNETDAIEIGQVVDNTGKMSDAPNSNVIVDHCSAGWATDEVFTIGTERGTVQWSIISECLYKSYHPKGAHSMGSIIRGSYGGVSMLHNIYAHNNSRNPKLGNGEVSPGAVFDVRNNVFYNWGSTPGYSNKNEHTRINLVGNYYKPGPSTRSNHTIAFRLGDTLNSIYVADNFHTHNSKAARDNWLLIHHEAGEIKKRRTAFPHPSMRKKTGKEIYEVVLKGAGAVLPARDPVDRRIINNIRTGKGAIINSQWDVGGWPVYKSTKAPADKDRDGMADKWETGHGLNARDPGDHKNDPDHDGYTNLEEYINGTDPNVATASLQDYAQYKAALEKNEALNAQGYIEAKAFEAARLKELANRPEPTANIRFSELPDDNVKNLTVVLNDSVKIKMNLVEAGTFTMGSPDDEPGRDANEREHQVTISKPYYLAVTELTAEQFGEVLESDRDKDTKPAKASWFDAVKYTEVLSDHSGYKFRLPTEAEWEYACRAGTTSANFSGQSISGKYANFNTREPGLELGTRKVAQTLANPWGFYDMPGNRNEWCSDIMGEYPVGPVTDPMGLSLDSAKGITMASRRVLRGGQSGSSWEYVRSAARYGYKPKVANAFRLVLELEKPMKPMKPANTKKGGLP
jgi:formylglycine-generating enzyme required for sulfatase activity